MHVGASITPRRTLSMLRCQLWNLSRSTSSVLLYILTVSTSSGDLYTRVADDCMSTNVALDKYGLNTKIWVIIRQGCLRYCFIFFIPSVYLLDLKPAALKQLQSKQRHRYFLKKKNDTSHKGAGPNYYFSQAIFTKTLSLSSSALIDQSQMRMQPPLSGNFRNTLKTQRSQMQCYLELGNTIYYHAERTPVIISFGEQENCCCFKNWHPRTMAVKSGGFLNERGLWASRHTDRIQ